MVIQKGMYVYDDYIGVAGIVAGDIVHFIKQKSDLATIKHKKKEIEIHISFFTKGWFKRIKNYQEAIQFRKDMDNFRQQNRYGK